MYRSLLIIVATVSFLTACGSEDDGASPISDTTPTPRPPIVSIPPACESILAPEVVDPNWKVSAFNNIEFESAFGEGGAVIGNAPIAMNDGESDHVLAAASGGQFVYLNGNSGKVYLHNIEIPEDGIYEFKFFANTQPGFKRQHIFIYETSSLDLNNLSSNQEGNAVWTQWGMQFLEQQNSDWHEVVFRPELSAGTYSIEMRLSWGFTYFDKLEFSAAPVRFASQYGITQGVHFTSAQNDITAPLTLNTNKLVNVTINGEPADFELNENCDELKLTAEGLSLLGEGTHQAQVNFDYLEPSIFEIKVVDGDLGRQVGERYEAENVSLGELMIIREHGDHEWDRFDDQASGNRYVSMENAGSIEFLVNIQEAGVYKLSFRYRTGGSDKVQDLKINGEFSRPGAGFRSSRTYWETASFPVELEAGTNKIEITKSWGYQDFDYFEINKDISVLAAEVTPKQQKFYQAAPKQLSIKVDPYGNTLSSVTITGTSEDSEITNRDLAYTTELYESSIEGRFTTVILGGFFAHLSTEEIGSLPAGDYDLTWTFENGHTQTTHLEVVPNEATIDNDFVVIFFDASHGNAALFLLPNGKSLVVDLGQWWVNLDRVIPFLKANNIDPDYLWLTHPHGDHIAGTYRRQVFDGFLSTGHETFVGEFPDVVVQRSMHEEDGGDREFFASGREFEFEGTDIKILNTFGDACSEETIAVNSCDLNANSLAFSMDYRGFVVQFQGDIYGGNQERIMRDYGLNAIRGQVFYGNHHWHGSISPDYVKNADPALIFVPASEVVYARGAFTQDAMEAVNYLKRNGSQYQDMLMSFDTGHLITRVNVDEDGEINWSYETLKHLAVEGIESDLNYPDYTDEQKQALHELIWLPHLDKWRNVSE